VNTRQITEININPAEEQPVCVMNCLYSAAAFKVLAGGGVAPVLSSCTGTSAALSPISTGTFLLLVTHLLMYMVSDGDKYMRTFPPLWGKI
jgi:hypothetical protein